jgi:hypothetical protein
MAIFAKIESNMSAKNRQALPLCETWVYLASVLDIKKHRIFSKLLKLARLKPIANISIADVL